MMTSTAAALPKLEELARDALLRSYSPYSRFAVGAAVLTSSGKVYSGCNVENASFGLCNCAERTAIFTAVAAGDRKIEAIAIYTRTSVATAPCGACRQVLNEFGSGARVICVCDSDDRIDTSLHQLLPSAFGPANLK
jgi:cytidine deaminase